MKRLINIALVGWLFLLSCSTPKITEFEKTGSLPEIYPDYKEVTIPGNIAPLNFYLTNWDKEGMLSIESASQTLKIPSPTSKFSIDPLDWKELLTQNEGKSILLTVYTKENDHWKKYNPFSVKIEKDSIDPYLVYRLIEPGYELWETMGIYQQSLETSEESSIYENKMTNYNCVNCHSFCMQDPDRMLLHMRGDYGGTFLFDHGNIEKLNTKTDSTISSFVYPVWHPSGKFIAFSVNNIAQTFYSNNKDRLEVFDSKSDLVIYNVDTKGVFTTPLLSLPDQLETFPAFSSDGKTLYFCSSKKLPVPEKSDSVKYSLCSIPFNETDGTFGEKVDTIFNAQTQNKSASFPRISPNGKYMLFTVSDYGTFPIWHKEADLMLYSLKDKQFVDMNPANSDDTESYHSWSSNSRWIVFSSRRDDGLYTRPYISHVGKDGHVGKAFMLPQKDPVYYKYFMKSYNIPEFVKAKVNIDAYDVSSFAKSSLGENVEFVSQNNATQRQKIENK
ncbi:TolB family protein [Sunxiuqinia sp. A32]|uniref:TolB family protein n=1 Tax=Sunxiuqinia sp. A32 TaxID=3461496 RepID=UPI0040461255